MSQEKGRLSCSSWVCNQAYCPLLGSGEAGAGVRKVPLPAFTPAQRGIPLLFPKAMICILLSERGALYYLASYFDGLMTSIKIGKPLKFTWGTSEFWWLCFWAIFQGKAQSFKNVNVVKDLKNQIAYSQL